MRRLIWELVGLGLLVVGLVVGLNLGDKITQFFSRASKEKASIEVDVNRKQGNLVRNFANLAQGGEESGGTMAVVEDKVKTLSLDYVRIDHIYDFYEVVAKDPSGSLSYNWTRLDSEVDAIVRMGAKPFLAMSYMPNGFSDSVVGKPTNWNDWQQLVQATISRYSGKGQKNIKDVYYEVWNEPDLFGEWKTYGEKNYLEMYRHSSRAAQALSPEQVNEFKLGGPGTTGMYPNWMEALFKTASEEDWRLDFVSWHRYSFDPKDFDADSQLLTELIGSYPKLVFKERIISEWGPDAKNHPAYDNMISAAHLMAVIRETTGKIQKVFSFEIMDGLSPENTQWWGRWGILAHKNFALAEKPRFRLFKWLKDLRGTRLALGGESDFVRGLAVENDKGIELYLVNYDSQNRHSETVPVTVKNLPPGSYEVTRQVFEGQTTRQTVTLTEGQFTDQVSMGPNQIVKISFVKLPETLPGAN